MGGESVTTLPPWPPVPTDVFQIYLVFTKYTSSILRDFSIHIYCKTDFAGLGFIESFNLTKEDVENRPWNVDAFEPRRQSILGTSSQNFEELGNFTEVSQNGTIIDLPGKWIASVEFMTVYPFVCLPLQVNYIPIRSYYQFCF